MRRSAEYTAFTKFVAYVLSVLREEMERREVDRMWRLTFLSTEKM